MVILWMKSALLSAYSASLIFAPIDVPHFIICRLIMYSRFSTKSFRNSMTLSANANDLFFITFSFMKNHLSIINLQLSVIKVQLSIIHFSLLFVDLNPGSAISLRQWRIRLTDSYRRPRHLVSFLSFSHRSPETRSTRPGHAMGCAYWRHPKSRLADEIRSCYEMCLSTTSQVSSCGRD